VNRFSPTPTRIGTTAADEDRPCDVGARDDVELDEAHAQHDEWPERGGFVEPSQPVLVEASQPARHGAVDA
jgi:hypothetical protein